MQNALQLFALGSTTQAILILAHELNAHFVEQSGPSYSKPQNPMNCGSLLRLIICLTTGLLVSAFITLFLSISLAILLPAGIAAGLLTFGILFLFVLVRLVFYVTKEGFSQFRLAQWQGITFWLWQLLHTSIWISLGILITWSMTSLFGTTLLIMALNAAWIACVLFVIAGFFTFPPKPSLGICWRDLPSVSWRKSLDFSDIVLVLSRRLQTYWFHKDFERLLEIVWEHRRHLELGGRVLELDDSRPLPVRFLFEFGNRIRALIPLFLSTFGVGLLLFLIVGGLLTDMSNANAAGRDSYLPTEIAEHVTPTPPAELPTPTPNSEGSAGTISPTPEQTQDGSGAIPSPDGTQAAQASPTDQESGGSQSGTQTAESSPTEQGSGESQSATQTAQASATGQSGGSQNDTQTAEASATGQGNGGSQSGTQMTEASPTDQESDRARNSTQTGEASATGQGSSGLSGATQTAETSVTAQDNGGAQNGTQTAEAGATGQDNTGSQSAEQTAQASTAHPGGDSSNGTQTAEASATGQGSSGSQDGTQTAEASMTGQGNGGVQNGTLTAEAEATGQGAGGSQSGTQTAEASATGQGGGGSQSGTQTAEASATGQGSGGGSQSGTQTAEASATGQGGGSQSGTQTAEASATGQGSGGQGGQVMTVPPGVTVSAQASAEGQGSGAGLGEITGTSQLEGSEPPRLSTPQPTIALPRNSSGLVTVVFPPMDSHITPTGVATQMVPLATPSAQGTAPRSTGDFVTPQPTVVGTWTPIQLLPNWIRALLAGL
jgi:hypothetical protein